MRSLFSYDRLGQQISPFLLLDYAAPTQFPPAARPRGVGEHPHRGFETVTIVYQGEVAHRDSAGNGGVIGPGDVQWMTAAGGILHEEFHSPAFTQRGGTLEMAQLWVNLPAAQKMSTPRYQSLLERDIPQRRLPDRAPAACASLPAAISASRDPRPPAARLVSGMCGLRAGHEATFSRPEGHSAAVAVLRGAISANDSRESRDAELVLLDRAGSDVAYRRCRGQHPAPDRRGLIPEPIVGYGPFVMNSAQEIETAVNDFRAGNSAVCRRLARPPALPDAQSAAILVGAKRGAMIWRSGQRGALLLKKFHHLPPHTGTVWPVLRGDR